MLLVLVSIILVLKLRAGRRNEEMRESDKKDNKIVDSDSHFLKDHF